MSIFNDFLSPMKGVFYIEQHGYQYKQKIIQAPVACSKMMEWDYYRDPTTIPQARGINLPKDLLMDFVIDEDRFDCLVDGKRQWVKWSDIFDVPISDIDDIFALALDGEFDSTLPMWNDNDDVDEVKYGGTIPVWHRTWEVRFKNIIHDTSRYWTIVSDTIVRNIEKHILPNVHVEISGGVVRGYNVFDNERYLSFQIRLISINGYNCCWVNNMQVALDMFHNFRTNRTKYYNPTINFMYKIIKNNSENTDINLSYN